MSQENNNILKICQLIVILVSVIFLGFAGLSALSAQRFSERSKSVPATIINVYCKEGTQRRHIEISYIVDGKNYRKVIYEYRTSWYQGEKIAVLYDPQNPYKVRIDKTLYFKPFLFGVLGSIFIVITIILVTYQQQLQSKQKKLIIEGNRVEATIIGCMINPKVKIYGRHPYRIEATYEDLFSKVVYHFQSHNIYHNPPNMLGLHVPVYVNPNNPKDYYMDLVALRNHLLEKGTAA